MVQATIGNKAISITLDHGESTTVPTGETWKVTATTDDYSNLTVNAIEVVNDSNGSGAPQTTDSELVLTGGDTLKTVQASSATGFGTHISGFVVN